MHAFRRVVAVFVAISLLVPGTVVAQSPSMPPAAIVLERVTEAAYGIGSVAPAGWTSAGMGIRTRGTPPAMAREFAVRLYAAGLGDDTATAEQVVRDYFRALDDRQDAAVRERLADRDGFVQSQVDAQLAALRSPWFLSLLRSDAGADWQRVTAPTLGVFGGKDVQVIADLEAPMMEAALIIAGNADVTIVTLPNANHLFQAATTGALNEYATLEQAFTPELPPLIVDWIVERTAVRL